MPRPLLIAPSLLAADPAHLAAAAQRAEAAGVDWLHVDIMDGHFVPNLTFGPDIVKAMRRSTKLPLDVHLMIERPDTFVPRFLEAGASIVTIHVETGHDLAATLRTIRSAGARCGLALNPDTSLDRALPFLDQIDLLLCMTVYPGFGGQAFIESVLEKAQAAAQLRDDRGLTFHVEADGGVNRHNVARCVAHGFDVLVAGTSLYGAPHMADAVADFRAAAESPHAQR